MKYKEKLELETSRQKNLIDGLMEFKDKDDKIRQKRTEAKLQEKVYNFKYIIFHTATVQLFERLK